MTPGNI